MGDLDTRGAHRNKFWFMWYTIYEILASLNNINHTGSLHARTNTSSDRGSISGSGLSLFDVGNTAK